MKKLYLLFAFLFALIGYQDAGAWDWDGSSPTADNLKLMGEGFSDATWDGTGISSTWDSSESFYYWDVTATSGTIKFRFKADGTWISPAAQTLTVGTWSTNSMKDGNTGGNQSVSVTSGSAYRIKVKKSADYTAICVVENGGGGKTISKVYLTNGSTETEIDESGSDYVLTQALTLTSGYGFKVLYSDNSTANYELTSNPSKVNQAYSLTSGSSTFALSSDIFASVTGLTVTVSGTALSTVSFAGTLKEIPVGDVYLYGQWTSDAKEKKSMTVDPSNSDIYTANISVTKKGSESDAWEFELVDNGTTYKEPGDYWYTDGQLGDAHVISTTSNTPLKHKLTAGRYTFTWNKRDKTLTITRYVDLSNINMPLKKSDFAGNKPHYFVVGTRMADWRLQPEWELHDEDGDGVYELDNRMVYTGMFGIAMVNDYDKYIKQEYTLYVKNNQFFNSLSDQTVTLDSNRSSSAEHYDKSDSNHKKVNTMRFVFDKDVDDTGMKQSTATLIKKFSLNTNSSNPVLSMTGITRDESELAKFRTFSLVGSDIRNARIEVMTPFNHQSNITGWQEGWIQYDGAGNPYKDAHGDAVYQTVFQNNWLEQHPSWFEDENHFIYSSRDIVFTFDQTATDDVNNNNRTIGDTEIVIWKPDQANNTTPSGSITNSAWQVFKVNGMWMQGAFKVWTGWGGHAKSREDSKAPDGENARWYYNNGGHEVAGKNLDINSDINYDRWYASKRDINDANWNIATRTYFNSVEFYWNPTGDDSGKGFDRSVLHLTQTPGSPSIQIARTIESDNATAWRRQIKYKYSVLEGRADARVADIKIVRTRADNSSSGYVDEATVYSRSWSFDDNMTKGNLPNVDQYVIDTKVLSPGIYQYRVELTYWNEGGSSKGTVMIEKSNEIPIIGAVMPNEVAAIQMTEGDNYTFDIKVTAGAPTALQDKTINEGAHQGEPMLSLIKWYDLTWSGENTTYAMFDAVTVGDADPVKVDDIVSGATDGKYTCASFTATVADGKVTGISAAPVADTYNMAAVILGNVMTPMSQDTGMPSPLTFKVAMTFDNNDTEAWSALDISDAQDDVTMVIPASDLIDPIVKLQSGEEVKHMQPSGEGTLMHNVRHGHAYEHKTTYSWPAPKGTGRVDQENGGYGKDLNEANVMTGEAILKQLKVTDRVLKDWNVSVEIRLMQGTSLNKPYSVGYKEGESASPAWLNKDNINVTIEYLPVQLKETSLGDVFKTDGLGAKLKSYSEECGYDFNYNDVSVPNVNYVVTTTYTRRDVASGDVTVTGAQNQRFVVNIDKLFPAAETRFSLANHGVTLHKATWQQWYDAHNVIEITSDKEEASRYAGVLRTYGFFLSNGTKPAKYEPTDPQHKIYPGGHVLDCSVDYANGYSSNYTVLPKRPSEAHFGEIASNQNDCTKIPVLIGNIQNVPYVADRKANPSDYAKAPKVEGVLLTTYPLALMPEGATEAMPVVTVTTPANAVITAEPAATPMALADSPVTGLITIERPSTIGGSNGGFTTDIDDIESDGNGSFSVYPNPAVDVVTVEASAEIGDVEVIASSGATVLRSEISDTKGQLDVSALPAGLYLLRTDAGTTRLIVR